MRNAKAITHIPGWVDKIQNADELGSVSDAYRLVPVVYRAVNLRADAVNAVPFTLSRGEAEVEWIYDTSPASLFWQIEASLALTGQAFIVKLNNGLRVTGLQWLNPLTMTVEYRNGELVFTQDVDGKTQTWASNEMIYLHNFDPSDDLTSGVAPVGVSLTDAQILYYTNVFATKFFEGGTMPAVILGIEGNPSPDEIKRLENKFSRAITSIKNAFGLIAIRGVVSPEVITPSIESLTLTDLRDEARLSIAHGMGIPITMLSDAANYATAKEHRLSFYQDTIIPEVKRIEEAFNSQLFEALGYRLLFNPQALSIFQEDEAARASSLSALTSAGTPLELAMQILGYDLTDEQWAMLATVSEFESVEDDKKPIEAGKKSLSSELAKWRRKAINGMKRGRRVSFKSNVIPQEDYAKLYVALSHCYTLEAIQHIFDEYEAGSVKSLIDYNDDVPQSQLDKENEFVPKVQSFLLEDAQFIADMYSLTDELPDKKDEKEKYAAFLIPFLTAWAIATITETAGVLGDVGLPITADVNALAAKWANKHALELASGLSDTTFALAKAEIEKSLLAGETSAQLASRLAEIIAPRWRAEMIAQTEVSRAINAAINEIGIELDTMGVKVKYVYRTAQDERVCPICAPMHGKKRAVGKEYVGGNRPPQHPRCRCREYIEVV